MLLQPDSYMLIAALVLVLLSLLVFFLLRPLRRRWLRWLWLTVVALCWCAFIYGYAFGVNTLEVRRYEYASDELPTAFDGYRIVLFSDVHAGTLTGSRIHLLERAVDSINAQQADMICFAGDLQNKQPDEIEAVAPILKRLKSRNGVFSVMGNHDYAEYTDLENEMAKDRQCAKLRQWEHQLGWTLLDNDHYRFYRGQDSIVIAGMENDGEGRFPQRGDVAFALWELQRSSFVVMLEHDPTSWRRRILPQCHAQLTLSGHTHGGQFSLFGLSPAALRYREYAGDYHAGNRALYVTRGLSGVVPFRLGVSPEIVVITLKSTRK